MAEPIIFCEPQCVGFEHSVFNAALLSTVLLAYPDSTVIFMAEPEHLRLVRENIGRYLAKGAERVEWREIRIPPRSVGGLRRVPLEWAWCRSVLRLAKSTRAACVIFSSIAESGILVLKTLLITAGLKTPVFGVMHSMINVLLRKQSFGFLRHGKGMRIALALPHPGSFRYLLLGEPLVHELAKIEPAMARQSVGLDIPYLWPPAPSRDNPAVSKPPKFGFYGVSAEKGFALYFSIAEDIRREFPAVEFELVGYLSGENDRALYAGKMKNLSTTPLSREEYARRADEVTYAVWTTDPERYRLCASSSFLDILTYGKPGIYLRNPYLDFNFRRMGDIGYLCDSAEEMKSVIRSVITSFPAERYAEQQRTILRERGIFEPASLAPKLRAIVENVRSS